jgi:hypothetical protein
VVIRPAGAPAGDRMTACEKCDGDGYVERWNDDQSGVVIELCGCDTPVEPIAALPQPLRPCPPREMGQR